MNGARHRAASSHAPTPIVRGGDGVSTTSGRHGNATRPATVLTAWNHSHAATRSARDRPLRGISTCRTPMPCVVARLQDPPPSPAERLPRLRFDVHIVVGRRGEDGNVVSAPLQILRDGAHQARGGHAVGLEQQGEYEHPGHGRRGGLTRRRAGPAPVAPQAVHQIRPSACSRASRARARCPRCCRGRRLPAEARARSAATRRTPPTACGPER